MPWLSLSLGVVSHWDHHSMPTTPTFHAGWYQFSHIAQRSHKLCWTQNSCLLHCPGLNTFRCWCSIPGDQRMCTEMPFHHVNDIIVFNWTVCVCWLTVSGSFLVTWPEWWIVEGAGIWIVSLVELAKWVGQMCNGSWWITATTCKCGPTHAFSLHLWLKMY